MVDINTIKLKYATFFADSFRQKKKNFYIGYTKTPSAIWNCHPIFCMPVMLLSMDTFKNHQICNALLVLYSTDKRYI